MLRNLGIVMLLLAAVAVAADLSGKWTGEVPGRQAAGTATFLFKVDGDTLTGTMTGPQGREVQIQDGKVSGDKISFSTQGGQAKILFEGTVSGDTIKMTRKREGGEGREFTLKRAQ
jgi:hypothetical protein